MSTVDTAPKADTAPKQGLLASITDNAVLTLLSDAEHGLSRAEVAHRSGISKPAISDAARRLENAGVIVAMGTREGRRGGVATIYAINDQRGHTVAIALDSVSASIRVTDLRGRIRSEITHPLPADADRQSVINAARSLLDAATADIDSPRLATTISVADPVDSRRQEIVAMADSVFPAGHISPITDLGLDPATSVVDNDVNWATLAEHHVGSMQQVDDFVYVYLGAGLGAGLFLGGALQRGTRGLAGEIGRVRSLDGIDLTHQLITLGFGRAGDSDSNGLDTDAALRVLSQPTVPPRVRTALEALTNVIANVATLLNPRAIVLGGPLAQAPTLVDYLADAVPQQSVHDIHVGVGSCTPLDGAAYEAHRMARSGLGF